MISLKRLEAMRRWQREGGDNMSGPASSHAAWAEQAGLLRINVDGGQLLIPRPGLAPAIAKAEAEHARHRTLEQREVNRRRAFDRRMASTSVEISLPAEWHAHAAYAKWWDGRHIHAWRKLRTLVYYEEAGEVDWAALEAKVRK